ncbi:MAG: alpha-1 6-glucosidase [Thermoleophilia bacterium]|nr:alpha-1 6-glucosidase [Thermoleophilia bacterium]
MRLPIALLAACSATLVLAGALPAERPRPPRPPAGAALAALAKPPARTAIASQRIYFVMTDRYANGDPSNDRGGLAGGSSATGFDPGDPGYFHGGDFRGLTGSCTDPQRGLARLKALGFTSVWVTPPYGQRAVQGDSAAYHGYWIRDFTGVDPHLGTNEDFGAFVECAHRLGLKVILDVVVNHTADYVLLPASSTYSDAPYRDCRGRRFNPARYVQAKRFPCLTAANMPKIPSLFGRDRTAKKPAWLNDVRRYHNRGDISFSSCSETCFEQGDFFGLDDLFTEQPVVMRGLADVYAGWIRRYKIDGFRIDTARHVNAAFFRLWVPRIRAAARAAGVKNFELFGEVFLGDAVELSEFVRRRFLPNVLDFPLQDALTRFASGTAGPRGIVTRLSDDDYFHRRGLAHTPPTFLGNHDMGRAAQQIRSKAGVDTPAAELLQRVLLGHSLLYLLRGAPVVYYGDEVGMIGTGSDKAARQDMFPTQVRDWRSEERVGSAPIGTGSSFDLVAHPVAERLKSLAALRDQHPALATGPSTVRYAQGRVLVVSRFDVRARHEYLVGFNAGVRAASVSLRASTPAASWSAGSVLFTGGSPVAVDASRGKLALRIAPLSAFALRADAQLPRQAPARPRLLLSRDDLTDMWEVRATSVGSPFTVSFAVRRATGKRWVRLAADDSPPYRAFLDPAAYRRGERVYIVGIMRSLDGRTAVSRALPLTPRRR